YVCDSNDVVQLLGQASLLSSPFCLGASHPLIHLLSSPPLLSFLRSQIPPHLISSLLLLSTLPSHQSQGSFNMRLSCLSVCLNDILSVCLPVCHSVCLTLSSPYSLTSAWTGPLCRQQVT